jgi:tetratricopeptide (TPR) repeat protein
MARRAFPLLITWALLAVILTTSGALFAQPATPSEEAALQAYREGSFSRAVQLYTRALSETDDPGHRAQLHVSVAWTLFALGRQGEVDTHLRAALVEDPELNLVPDYYTREFIELFDSTKARARSAALDSSAAPPPDLEATLAAVDARLESGRDLEGALADVEKLLVAYPGDGRLLPLRAELLRLLGRDAEAQTIVQTYGSGDHQVPVDSLSIPDLILRANRLLDEGDAEAAFGLLREAVSRQPSNVAALELMAESAVQTGRWQDAEFALKSALGLQPDNLNLQLRLGGVYLAKNDTSAARDVFRELTERYPHSDRAWASLGLLDAQLGNHQRALHELEQALQENPLLPEVQLGYGELLLANGRAAEALAAFHAAKNLLPDDPQLEARTGQALLAAGRDGEVAAHLRAAIDGGFRPFDVQRSWVLSLIGDGVYAEAERALAEIPGDPRRDRDIAQGVLLLEQGAFAQSEAVLRRAAELRPSDAALLNLLAAAIYEQQRYGEAVEILRRAADLQPENLTVAGNLERAEAARAAELLAERAEPVRAAAEP